MVPAWSPDGEWITVNASVRDQRDVYVVNAKGGGPRAVASDPADGTTDWSADGKRLIYASERDGARRLWSVPREGGEPTAVDREPPRGVADPTGTFRYVADRGPDGWWSIGRRRAGGGPLETVIERAGTPALALTTRGVYFAQREPADSPYATHLAFLDLATRQTTKVVTLRPGFHTGWSVSVSPDERTLLYTQCDAKDEDNLILVEGFR